MLEKVPEALGRALHAQRAGVDSVVFRRLGSRRELAPIRVHSTAFGHMDTLPVKYTADGDGISPPLTWSGVPDCADQVLLIVEDADSPTSSPLVHAIALMEGIDGALGEGALPSSEHPGAGVSTGLNSLLQHRWLPPDPPPGHGAHRYVFQVFALSRGETLSDRIGRHDVEQAIADRAIAGGWLMGLYERPRRQSAAKAMPADKATDEPEAPSELAQAGGAVVS